MESSIQKKIEQNGIIINRVPGWAREIFKDKANFEFESDYGMCLAAILKDSIENNRLKEMFFDNKLGVKIALDGAKVEDEDMNEVHMANGKTIKYGGKKQ